MICVIDNNESFVCNLVQYAGNLGADCVVHRNDEVTVEQVVDLDPELIIISPGPVIRNRCSPNRASAWWGNAVRGMRSRVSAEGLVAA